MVATGCDYQVRIGERPELGEVEPEPQIEACLRVLPEVADFGVVAPGASSKLTVSVENGCEDTATVTGFRIEGDPGFAVMAAGGGWQREGNPTAGVTLPTPIVIGSGATLLVEVAFQSDTPAPARATLRVMTGEGDATGQLIANIDGPCLEIDTGDGLAFGCQLVGTVTRRRVTLRSCGGSAATVSTPSLAAWSSPDYALDLPAMGAERSLAPGESIEFDVVYAPAEGEVPDDPALVLQDAGELVIESDAFTEPARLALAGFGRDLSCDAVDVELSWETPGDLETTDAGLEAGADLDLHFRHGFVQRWYDIPFDAYWFNSHPSWGVHGDPADDPAMGPDVYDGTGVEILTMALPEDGQSYRVGVHYWDDHGYGPSIARVQVRIFGHLEWESDPVELVPGDLWEVAEVVWPKGAVVKLKGAGDSAKVLSNFEAPCNPSGCKGK